MSKIIVTDPLLSELDGCFTPTELCDPSGRSLGHFLPSGAAAFQPRDSDQCPYSPEELARMQTEAGGRSLADILDSFPAE
ncbi:MAG: hypothetical protein IIC01_09610 [Planctomycetes bacterium]|nr:hypothetical protein [Planctomycetota bacterium]